MRTAEFLAKACYAQITGPQRDFSSVSIDTRTLQAGALYVALRGENFDGHRFVEQAVAAGATGVLVSEAVALPDSVTILKVPDTLLALQLMGHAARNQFTGSLIAVTGSNGKTTTRQLIASILRNHFGDSAVLATDGNFNNHIGVPLTLLRLSQQHRVAVVEMGMNHFNELHLLTSLARPSIGVITNAGPAHLEGVGSLAGVAHSKAEVFRAMATTDTAVLNADDYFLPYWEVINRGRYCVRFGLGDKADVRGEFDISSATLTVTHGLPEALVTKLPFAGEHNARNALAAVAVARLLAVPAASMKRGLETAVNIGGRLARREINSQLLVIDDSYNANPSSVRAGLQVLLNESRRKILVLGDMAELGEESDALHVTLLRDIERSAVDSVITLGPRTQRAAAILGGRTHAFSDIDTLVAFLARQSEGATTVLVKGAHSMAMYRVVGKLDAMFEGKN